MAITGANLDLCSCVPVSCWLDAGVFSWRRFEKAAIRGRAQGRERYGRNLARTKPVGSGVPCPKYAIAVDRIDPTIPWLSTGQALAIQKIGKKGVECNTQHFQD